MPTGLGTRCRATIDPAGEAGGPVVSTPTLLGSPKAIGDCSWTTMPEALSSKGVSWKVYQPSGTSTGPFRKAGLAVGFNTLLYFKQYQQKGSALYNQAFLPTWPADFTSDVNNGTLPQVSWILPPLVQSDHPSAPPENGEWMISQVFEALTSNPAVWSKTVLFITYDENGGFSTSRPAGGASGHPGRVPDLDTPAAQGRGIAGPIGLGFRVPALVVSPFSRGGVVNSDVFDHTSTLLFLEQLLRRAGPEPHRLAPVHRRRPDLDPRPVCPRHHSAVAAAHLLRRQGAGRGVPREHQELLAPLPGTGAHGSQPPGDADIAWCRGGGPLYLGHRGGGPALMGARPRATRTVN